MNYILDEKKNLSEFDISTPDYVPLTLAQVGDTCLADGIEVLCIYFYDQAELSYKLFVDKNHDLSYYIVGSDMVDSGEYNHTPGAYGYEWGAYGTETGVQNTNIGSGLSNTNTLISRNLGPHDGDWWVIWEKVKEFRQSHSDNWFVPSKDELNLIYETRSNLSNLSTSNRTIYWSSSEHSGSSSLSRHSVWIQDMTSGYSNDYNKSIRYLRTRLCYYLACPDPTIT